MKNFSIRRLLLSVLFAFALLAAAGAAPLALERLTASHNPDGAIALQRPPFLNVANAEMGDAQTFADDEAGIAAYINLNQTVNLSVVDDVCRTTESSTADYFLCSVGVPDYDESQDVKVYVQKTGWALAYYPRTEATGKIFDWRHYDGGAAIPTKLEKVLERVLQKAGSSATGISYYHFAHPGANKMLLIAEKASNGASDDSFTVNLPSSFNYFERSWSLGTEVYESTFKLDGQAVATTERKAWALLQGTFGASQLTADTSHTIDISSIVNGNDAYGGLALIYKVP